MPSAVFSNPQVATVGLTEAEATEQGLSFVVGIREYAGTAYGWALVDTTSFAKVLVDSETGLIIGAHIIGQQAASLIQPLVQAMEFDQPAADVAGGVFYIHPALTEVVENALARSGRPDPVSAHAAARLTDAEIEQARAVTPGCAPELVRST